MRKLLIILALLAGMAFAQTPVVLAPLPQLQFFTQTGLPLGNGCVFSYQSNTVTPLATYTDYTGTVQNANPVILSAGGSANIWLAAGQAYTLVVKSFGGTNCALGTTQYTVNGIGNGTTQNSAVITPVSGSATFTVQSQNQLFTMTLTGNVTGQPVSAVGIIPPAFVTFKIIQDGVGGHTFSWPANSIGGSAIGLSANQITTQTFLWDGTSAFAVSPAVEGNGPIVAIGTLDVSSAIVSPAFVSSSANPSGTGILRLASGDGIGWRNNANGADVLLYKDSSDNLNYANGLGLGGAAALTTTAQTGTGSLVLQSSPTINSPTLTSPQLGVATATSLACGIGVKTGAYTLTTSDCIIQANATGGSFTLTIPHAATGQIWSISRTDGTNTNAVTLAGDSGNINNVATLKIPVNMTVFCHADGVNSWCTPVTNYGSTSTVCTTTGVDAGSGACTSTVTWNVPFPDTNYKAVCTGVGYSGAPRIIDVNSLTTNSVTVTIGNGSSAQAVASSYASLQCIGVHP